MNTIVRRHYPAERLPEDLRPEGAEGALVEVTVRAEEAPSMLVRSLDEIFAEAPERFLSKQEIDDHIRELRADWDGRTR